MADPLTGLATVGAVSALLQVIDFSAKVISETKKLLESSDDALRENIVVERLTLEHSTLMDRLVTYNNTKRPLDSHEQAVDKLAQECKQESAKLLKQLDELKVEKGLTGAKRVWQSTRKTAKALQKRKAIEQQQKYLDELNNQLSTTLLHILRITQLSGFEAMLERLVSSENKNASVVLESKQAILQAMKAYSERIDRWFSETYSKIESVDRRLIQQDEDEKLKLIIDSLRFPEMRLRRDTIPRAYKDTFGWIFKDSSSTFRAWLGSSEDIFWVSGKAGSGKSTLMKFISSHPRTKKYLQLWAGDHHLVVVDSYLWNPGTALQRNEQGMLQEILYRILSTNLDLVEIASPTRWNSDVLYLRRPDPWSREELLEALDNVLKYPDNQTHFCFFIDGLDEYHGEHSRLISTLRGFAKHPRIKMCVSSRPWNVFRNAFKDLTRTFYLEELTHQDICQYVEGELSSLSEELPSAQALVSQIVTKAKGVFLWVFLVIRSLREGLEEGDSLALMQQRVNEFPADLEDYFRLILSRVSKTYRKQTSQALKLATLLLGDNIPHHINDSSSFMSFWILSQGMLDNPRFAFDLDIQYIGDEIFDMAADTRKFLNACCKDFLCIAINFEGNFRDNGNPVTVEFLHRTVYDFLENEDMRQTIDESVPEHFKHRLFPSQLALSRIKYMRKDFAWPCENSTHVIYQAMEGIEGDDQTIETITEYHQVAINYLQFVCSPDCQFHKPRIMQEGTLRKAVACFASHQLHSFIEMLIAKDPSFVQATETETWSFLEPALGLAPDHPFPIVKIDLEFVHLLLQHGSNPNLKKMPVWHAFLIKAIEEAPYWSPSDLEHATKVAQMVASEAEMQMKVSLPPGLAVPGHESSNNLVTPLELFNAVFPTANLGSMYHDITE